MTVQPHLTVDELLQAAKNATNLKTARRIQAVAMAQQSLASATIAQLTGDAPRSIRRWVNRYNLGGIDALGHRSGAGRKPNLPPEKEQAFKDRIDAGPTDVDKVSVLHGKDYQRILEEEFGIIHSLSGVYNLLHRLGYSWLMPRPKHEKADDQAQAEFKKTS
jgi:transposase